MKKLQFILIILLFSNPNFLLAKMIKTPEGIWINENMIYEVYPIDDFLCKVKYYYMGLRYHGAYTIQENCDNYIIRLGIGIIDKDKKQENTR